MDVKRMLKRKLFEAAIEIEKHGRISPWDFPFCNPWALPWGEEGIVRIEETEDGVVISYKEFGYDDVERHILTDEFRWIIGQGGKVRREERIGFGGGKPYAEEIEEILRQYQPVVRYISLLRDIRTEKYQEV